MPVYDADACVAAPWDIARGLTLQQLYNYKGQMVPWPCPDEWARWWGQTIPKLHKIKRSLDNGFTCTDKFEPHDVGIIGEYAFGPKTGLRPWLQVWPDEIWYDYKFGLTTIDVKTTAQESREVHLALSLKEIARNKKTCDGKMANIFVLAWLPSGVLEQEAVEFLGWAYQEALLTAPIKREPEHRGWKEAAHALHRRALKPMASLYGMIEAFLHPPRDPHWHEPPPKKGQQQSLFKI